jgi:hypothetical protein
MSLLYCKYCHMTHSEWSETGKNTRDGSELYVCERCRHTSAFHTQIIYGPDGEIDEMKIESAANRGVSFR